MGQFFDNSRRRNMTEIFEEFANAQYLKRIAARKLRPGLIYRSYIKSILLLALPPNITIETPSHYLNEDSKAAREGANVSFILR
jgi:hypothetical protein